MGNGLGGAGSINAVANVIAPIPGAWIYAHWGFAANLYISAGGRLLGALGFLWLLRSGALAPDRAEPPRAAAKPASAG